MNARLVSSHLLSCVMRKRISLTCLLDLEYGDSAFRLLSQRDQILVRAIVNVTLRFLPRIDAVLDFVLISSLPRKKYSLQQLLRVSVAQILYLDVADYAVVDLAVEQAKRDKENRHFAKLVNSILRRVSREKIELLQRIAGISIIPEWFKERLENFYGKERVLAISDACISPLYIDLTVKFDIETWAHKLNAVMLPTGGIRLKELPESIVSLPGFAEGVWWVQDASASIPVQLFGTLNNLSVLDLCAAPGGKTAQLIVSGAKVTALDVSKRRLEKLRCNLDRLHLYAEDIIEMDAFDYCPKKLFDAVLVDAPCSSTGTIRRHPDVLWTRDTDDIVKSACFQRKLLLQGISFVKPGGIVVFSNCSLDKQDSEEVVQKVLRSSPIPVELVPLNSAYWKSIDMAMALSPEGWIRITPDMLEKIDGVSSGMDGFFAVALRRLIQPK
ncbi:RsmB/NOP family class I SAM-dependent RNA methyltransferase [Candidatus Liberibacter asiaticus]|nr:RsmB/NOP family class I SAM-dependent RNA methyltransferase [Candidatus Liberibacter asiaticus]KAE9510141.1 Ribosomal RNA small subunit methyltransferase B [Candidatus Liberibacter asiaticus]KAE9512271.1 Ribosomal RNA small subunit methyltransferase B [Candidatus Liberibacter asiaticus]KAE9513365.1 Ribosomal RNA small subunit methyltransferase B [Candidatus Liberibacter asiaticus]KAE9514432.1 Ribosomal RNA small subunit methyltransferase B [Candidatus Liberibacter asiaticus]KAE9515478.1 Rib